MSFDWLGYIRLAEHLSDELIDEYLNSENENERSVGWILIKLRKQRNYADYNEDKYFNKEIVKNMISLAKDILTLMEIA